MTTIPTIKQLYNIQQSEDNKDKTTIMTINQRYNNQYIRTIVYNMNNIKDNIQQKILTNLQ